MHEKHTIERRPYQSFGEKRGALDGWQRRLQRVDRALLDALPFVGRTCWETVLVLAR